MYLTKVYARPERLMRFCISGKGYLTRDRAFTPSRLEKSFVSYDTRDYTTLTKEKSCT